MVSTPIRVGLVGANAHFGWAKDSHIPALQALPDFALAAVATRNYESAREAARVFGAQASFSNFRHLIQSDDVDLVVVSVQLPAHLEVVEAALAARKHVLCEWALGRNTAEADQMAEAARRMAVQGVHTAIGLQGRMSPAVRRAAELVQGGAIGRPLTASIYCPSPGLGPTVRASLSYFGDPNTGSTLASIIGGHTLDIAISVLGGIDHLAVLPTIMFKDIELIDPPGNATRTSADHLLIQARLRNGCALNVELAGNRPLGSAYRFRIVGTEGELALRGDHPFGPQASDLQLEATVPFEPPEPMVAAQLEGPPVNIAEMYASFGRDIRSGRKSTPDFAHAARMHRLIDSINLSGATGERQQSLAWPAA
jgi:predicted dehydrogenase